jgi:hypothetical protein
VVLILLLLHDDDDSLTHTLSFSLLVACADPHYSYLLLYCSGHAPEAEFLAKLKAIKGVSQVETQTITNVEI